MPMTAAVRQTSVFTMKRPIAAEEQSTYIEVPFEMPEGVEEIHVAYEVESHGASAHAAIIDLGVRDAVRVRGWSGGARSEFRIGREAATPGYLAGDLTRGSWAVLHNAYVVPAEGCTVTITVQLLFETPRWLKGDLHMHSVHSDGKFTLEENARIMEELGCDFLAMTDHNAVSQNFSYPRNTGIVMIPGMEFTTNFGHSNFLGVADPADDFRVADRSGVDARLRTARERGAKIVLNHPHCTHCPWLWEFNVDHDWVEVWNGGWRESNQSTLDWWHEQLVSGRRLVAVGGSDTHRPNDPYFRHAMPTTWVFSRTKTVQGILDGIDQGHVVLSVSPAGPFMELTCGTYMIGDVVPVGDGNSGIEFRAESLVAGDRVKLISNRGTETEIVVTDSGPIEIQLPREGRSFYRAEVWRHFQEVERTLLAGMTNPLYLPTE